MFIFFSLNSKLFKEHCILSFSLFYHPASCTQEQSFHICIYTSQAIHCAHAFQCFIHLFKDQLRALIPLIRKTHHIHTSQPAVINHEISLTPPFHLLRDAMLFSEVLLSFRLLCYFFLGTEINSLSFIFSANRFVFFWTVYNSMIVSCWCMQVNPCIFGNQKLYRKDNSVSRRQQSSQNH